MEEKKKKGKKPTIVYHNYPLLGLRAWPRIHLHRPLLRWPAPQHSLGANTGIMIERNSLHGSAPSAAQRENKRGLTGEKQEKTGKNQFFCPFAG